MVGMNRKTAIEMPLTKVTISSKLRRFISGTAVSAAVSKTVLSHSHAGFDVPVDGETAAGTL